MKTVVWCWIHNDFLHGIAPLKICLVTDGSDELPEFSTGDQIPGPAGSQSYLIGICSTSSSFLPYAMGSWDKGMVMGVSMN